MCNQMTTAQGGKRTCIFIVGYLIYFSITQVSGQYHCHCAEGCRGNVEEYRCNSCKEGYHGYYCQMENVALRKQAQHSEECKNVLGKASLAVDGDTTTEFGDKAPHRCTCSKGKDKFWSVDLGKEYPIKNIKIYQRNQIQKKLLGFHIEIDGHECYRWRNTSDPPTVFDVTCDGHGRKVTFRIPEDIDVLTLCEIQIYVCADFWYGDGCMRTCNCRNIYEVCDKKTGKCTACPDHYTGDACDVCENGYWGEYCLKCGHCMNGYSCDKTTGHCLECQPGWKLPRCSNCLDYLYGCNCDKICSCEEETQVCDKETGACDGESGESGASVDDGFIAAIGATLCVVFVIAAAALGTFFWRRKKKPGSEDKDILVTHAECPGSQDEDMLVTNAEY
ncbi:protein draper-like [Gigantopelta aegis]|uniref:protein draper-like n=1 Tax=Gigantopelta aegis TaxID=1735272 RepID=UPI001B88C03D|nr:protein draper-like [Gigantopelta aegis]